MSALKPIGTSWSMRATPKMRFVESGPADSPRVLVLVHAFPAGVRQFDPQLEAFARWRMIAAALPGFDGSDLLDRPSVDEYANRILLLLDDLHVQRAVCGGVSLGGYVVFGMLRQAPERIRGLLLADTRITADTETMRADRTRVLQLARSEGAAAVATDMLPKLLGDTSHRTRPAVVAAVRRLIEAQSTEGIAAALVALMSRPDSTPLLGAIRVPTLVVVGAEDRLTPPEGMKQMASAIPGARYVEINRAGHLANLEDPETFNREVARWLEQFDART